MPKTTDITGSFRVPEEAWGRFWNVMLSIPGAEVTPIVAAKGPKSKRSNGTTAGGSTSNCLILHALVKGEQARPVLSEILVAAGKVASSVGSSLQDLKTKKLVKRTKTGWGITAAGKTWLKENCNG